MTLAASIAARCRLSGTFVLRSGRTATEYFDKYQFEADPVLLDAVGAGLAPLVPPGTEVLAGLEMGGIAVVVALARHAGLPCAFVRKAAKPYGTRRLAEGADLAGRRVLLVEDVVTSGGQIALSAAELRVGRRDHRARGVRHRPPGGRRGGPRRRGHHPACPADPGAPRRRLTGPAPGALSGIDRDQMSDSAAMVVSVPWPVWTTVSRGRVSRRVRIDSRIVGLSENDRPVAPGPPWKRVSPVKTTPRDGADRQTAPGLWPGVCRTVRSVPATVMT